MFYVRTTKTASLATAVQIVRYENRKKIIVLHIGSARTKEELLALKKVAEEWIGKNERQLKLQLFPSREQGSPSLIALDKCQYLGIHYHSLWHVEQAFRVAKSDLEMRPIYHFKEHTIKAHILICFMALAVSKYMEIKTGKSLKVIIKILTSVTDARIFNTLTNEEIIMRSQITEETKQLLQKLDLWY